MGGPLLIPRVLATVSKVSGVPLQVLVALGSQESGFQQGAVSPAGAIGIFQLMPGTASSLGVDPHDLLQNAVGAAKYIGDLYRRFGSWPLAFAAYNAGPGAVEKYHGIPPFPETQQYVRDVQAMINAMQ